MRRVSVLSGLALLMVACVIAPVADASCTKECLFYTEVPGLRATPVATPAATSAAASPLITMTSATYGGNCGAPTNNELSALSTLCNGQASCSGQPLAVANNVDPAYGCTKTFVATWTCASGSAAKSVSLPAEAGFTTFTLTCP